MSLQEEAVAGLQTEAVGDPLRILVVDDDEVDRLMVLRGLRRGGLPVHISEATDEATARARATEGDIDCVILDYNVPGSDGLRLLKMFRAALPRTPVIMLTGQGDEQVAVELMKAGASDYLPKSAVTPELLAQSVRYAVELNRASDIARQKTEELKESARRSRFLAEASAVLTRSLDPRETIGELARLTVPFLADYCVIYRVDDDGNPDPVASAHHDPLRQDAAAVLGTRHRPALEHPRSPVALAIRSGERALVHDVTDELLADIAGDEDLLAAFRQLDPATLLVLPLTARQRIRGAMALGRSADRAAFDDAEIELAEDLASRTALAFDNAGLYEAAEQARRRTERLQHVTASLAQVLPRAHVAELFVTEVRAALGADTAWVAVADGNDLRRLAHSGYTDEEIQQARVRADVATPVRDSMRDGRERWFDSSADVVRAYPELADVCAITRSEGLGVLPLDAGAARLGVMTIGFRDRRTFTDADRALARALAGQCAQALERARLYDAERDARERAETANRAKSEFLARMSHDLRTPLNAIGGYAELVELGLRGPVTEEQTEAMARIKRAKDHLLTLINDILSFAKLEAGQVTISVDSLDIADVARGLRQLIEPQITARGLTYDQRGDEGVLVRADRERLVQVLLNLLTNAVKFTDRGSVSVTWKADGDVVRIDVADTGCGISSERLPTIFDPFVQAGSMPTEEREGVGLGLAISRELIRLMGGQLSVRSELGQGTVFTVTLAAG